MPYVQYVRMRKAVVVAGVKPFLFVATWADSAYSRVIF